MSTEKNKVCIITGATGDLGFDTAEHLAQQGYTLRLTGRNPEKLYAILSLVQNISPDKHHTAYQCDTTKNDNIIRTMHDIFNETELPGVLINGAAILEEPNKLCNYADGLIEKVIATNLTGTVMMTKEYIARLLDHDMQGEIITRGSTAGLYSYADRSIYAATKAGLKHFMESIALEYKNKGIDIHYLCPGPIAGEAINKVIRDRAELRNIHLPKMTKKFSQVVSDDGTFVAKETLFATVDKILSGELKDYLGEDTSGHTFGIDTIGMYDASNPRAINDSAVIKDIPQERAIQYDKRRYIMKWDTISVQDTKKKNAIISFYKKHKEKITKYGIAAMIVLIIGGISLFGKNYLQKKQKEKYVQAACEKYGVNYDTFMKGTNGSLGADMVCDIINREAYRLEAQEQGFDIGSY